MPLQPTTRQLISANAPLQNLSIAYRQSQDEFNAERIFPIVNVDKQGGVYYVYKKGDWFRTVAAKRAPATESVGTGWNLDNLGNYFCDKWSVHHDIADEDYGNAPSSINIEDDAQQFVTRQLLLRKELVFTKTYLRANIWQGLGGADYGTGTGSGAWNSDSSNPMKDFDNIRRSTHSRTGYQINTVVVTSDVYYALKNHPVIIDRFKYTQPGILDKDILASIFGIPAGRFFIVNAILNTAQEGQNDNLNYMASNAFLACYSAPSAGLRQPSAGYNLSWTGMPGANGQDIRIKKFYMEAREATRIEGDMCFDMRATGLDLGVFGTPLTP